VGAQPVGGAQRDLLALGGHAEEAAVPHHREHAGQGERRRRVEGGERRGTRGRADDPAVTQAVR